MNRAEQAPKASLGQPASDDCVDEDDVCGKEVGAEPGGTSDGSAIQEKPGLKGAAWQCLCPRGNWQENRERAKANDSPIWIQCSADAAMTILRKTYELSTDFECSCRFAGFERLFGGRQLTDEDCLDDALIVFHWESRAFQRAYTTKVLYETLASSYDEHCTSGVPCCCSAGRLIEVPAEMAQRLLELDVGRRHAISAAKASQELAAATFLKSQSKPMRILAATPLHLLRHSPLHGGYAETQLPAQHPIECVYLGQPKVDGSYAHASIEWTRPGGARDTGLVFEWRAPRGDDDPVATRTCPPMRYDGVRQSKRVPIPEHFTLAKDMLCVFENVCQRSLARLAREYTPPCTVVSCRLLGVPKHETTVGQGDFRTFFEEDGRAVEHLLVSQVKGDVYVCCSDPEAWTAARSGKLGMAHFVFCDLGIGKLPKRVQARKVSDAQRPLRSLAMADPEATSAILAVGKLIASCAKIAACGWESQFRFEADGFEVDPWRWVHASQRSRPMVYALWTTLPLGDRWQGKPKRFFSATLVNDLLQRRHFPVPGDLKASPVAPLEQYWNPGASSAEHLSGLDPSLLRIISPENYVCCPPNELQAWMRRRGLGFLVGGNPRGGDATSGAKLNGPDRQADGITPKAAALSFGVVASADPTTGCDSSSDSEDEIGVASTRNAVVTETPAMGLPQAAATATASREAASEPTNLNAAASDAPGSGLRPAATPAIASCDATSEEEDACGEEDLGRFYDQDSETELFGALEPERRKQYYHEWCTSIDEIELGYGLP